MHMSPSIFLFTFLCITIGVVYPQPQCDYGNGCGPNPTCTEQCCKCNSIGICEATCCAHECINSVDCPDIPCNCKMVSTFKGECVSASEDHCDGILNAAGVCMTSQATSRFIPDSPVDFDPPAPPKLPEAWNATVQSEIGSTFDLAVVYPQQLSWHRRVRDGHSTTLICDHSLTNKTCFYLRDNECRDGKATSMIPQEPLKDPEFVGTGVLNGHAVNHWRGVWVVPHDRKCDYYADSKTRLPVLVRFAKAEELSFKKLTTKDVSITIPAQCPKHAG